MAELDLNPDPTLLIIADANLDPDLTLQVIAEPDLDPYPNAIFELMPVKLFPLCLFMEVLIIGNTYVFSDF